jgi:hypothetical protein
MHKAGDKNQKRVAAREEKGREDTEEAEWMLTILTDPFDNIDWATKKHLGLFFYFTHLKDNSTLCGIHCSMHPQWRMSTFTPFYDGQRNSRLQSLLVIWQK